MGLEGLIFGLGVVSGGRLGEVEEAAKRLPDLVGVEERWVGRGRKVTAHTSQFLNG